MTSNPKDYRKAAVMQDVDLRVIAAPGEHADAAMARTALRPSVRAAETWRAFTPSFRAAVDFAALVNELSRQSGDVFSGDMRRPEALLVSQAHALDAIFNELARRAALNIGEHIGAAEIYMKLALRAQNQCRAALETLSNIKNPAASVAFVTQANVANGPQQVVNTFAASAAKGPQIEQSKLMEVHDAERLDEGTTSTSIGASSSMEAVDAIDGATHSRR